MMVLLGVILGRLVWSGGFGWFVQQRMRLPVIGAAVMLVIFGGFEVWASWREEDADPDVVDRPRAPVVGWLLGLPIVVLYSVAPTGLGAAAADRVEAYTPTDSASLYEPLPTDIGPVPMTVFEFLDRASWDPDRSLEGQTVRLEGLVVNDPSVPDGFKLTRFLVSCCAADGVPLQVVVRETGEPLPNDTWVVVDLRWLPPTVPYQESEGSWDVEAEAMTVTVVPDAPNDPYESPY